MVLTKEVDSKKIAFYLQDGVEVLDFAGPMEVFAYAGYEVFTVSKDKGPIKSQGILKIVPDYSIDDAPAADILAFYGGNSQNAYQNKAVIEWVKNQEVQYHFSVCTGAFVLAEAGVLDNKTATTFHESFEGLESYDKIDVRRGVRFVDNGNVITTAGVSAGIDGALHLVAKLQDLNAAKRTAYYMEYDNWKPGDGLLLSGENPYLVEATNFKSDEGRYETKEGFEMNVQLIDDELMITMQGTIYPFYHEGGDIFSDVRNESIYFERDGDVVLGYRLEPNGNLYKKLD